MSSFHTECVDAEGLEAVQGALRSLDQFTDIDTDDGVGRRADIVGHQVEVDQQPLVGGGQIRRLGRIGEGGQA